MDALQQYEWAHDVPISLAKISRPTLARHTINRPRLLPAQDAVDQLLLAVITAPAGYGKTAAAEQLATMLDPNPSWFTLEAADNEICVFLAHVCAALQLNSEDCAKMKAALDDPERGASFAIDVLRVAIEELPHRVVLVLDDFHKLTNPELLAALTKWLVVPPEQFTMICVGRSQPRLPLQRTRTHGRLFELRSEQLAFTKDEIAESLVCAFGEQAPTTQHVDAIMEATQGWPSAVYLAGLAATKATDQDAPQDLSVSAIAHSREMDDYLRAVIPISLSKAEIDFLTDTSILDPLVPDLCDAVTMTSDSATTLQRLVETERFVAPNAGFEPAYHCNRLVRNFLREQLARNNPEKHALLYNRAAGWYQTNEQLGNAIRCATAIHDVELGQRLVGQSWRNATSIDNFEAVREWADVVGPDGTAQGSVCVVLAWGAMVAFDEPNMRRWLARADALATGRRTGRTIRATKNLALAHWAGVCGDIATMLEHVDQAQDAVAEYNDFDYTGPGLAILRTAAAVVHGTGELLNDNVDAAAELLSATVTETRGDDDDHTLVTALSYLGLLEALRGNYERALVHADEVAQRSRTGTRFRPIPALNHLTRSMARLAMGAPREAEEELDAALALSEDQYYPVERGIMLIQKARLHHRRGGLAEARKALRLARSCTRTASPSLLDRLVRSAENELRFIGLGSNDQLPLGARELTQREIEILHILPEPLSRAEIANQLHISENTVKTHLTAISRKLAVHGRAAIVERALELSLLSD